MPKIDHMIGNRMKPQKFHDVRAFGRMLRMRARLLRHPMTVSDSPAFDPVFEQYFRDRLTRARFYLEFGSGASSILAARAGIETLSVESDARFAAVVADATRDAPHSTMIHADIGLTEEWGYPVLTSPTPERLAAWRGYTQLALDAVAKRSHFPDLVLVDGRFRVACALASANAALSGGHTTEILFDDYTLRRHYHAVENYLGDPAIIGRSAQFIIDPATSKPIPERAITAAQADYR